MSAIVVAWYPFSAMHVARARRIRPRRWASSTAGSSAGSTRFRIRRDCKRGGAGERTHRAQRKQRGARGVVPEVTIPAPARPTARAYLVWGVALFAYVVAVFHRSSLGVAAVDAQERFSAGASAISLF